MKHIKWIASFALAGVILTAQPTFLAQASPVISGPGVEINNNNAPGPHNTTEPQSATVPGGTIEVPVQDVNQAPPGDEGTTLAPAAPEQEQGTPVQPEPQPETQPETPVSQGTGRTIDPSRPMVALTFDDGPQPSVGNRIMDCMAQYGGKATFFMVGDRVASRKTELQRMVAEGHEVANHTMNHKYLQKLGAGEIQAQVNKCNDAIQAACGVRPTIMRLPGGNHNATVVANTGMPMIQWNIDTLDWKTKNADKTVEAVLNHVKDGDIVLMHELYSQSGDAALRIIPELHKRGYQMVTVSEMAAAKGHSLQAGKLYSSFK